MTFEIVRLPMGGERQQATSLNDLPAEHQDLLDKPIYACVATLRKSGPPHLTMVWTSRDDDHIYINSNTIRVKHHNMVARPEISLMIVNPENPYHWLSVEGKVVEIVDEEDPQRAAEVTRHIDDMGELYVNKRPYPNRFPGEVRVMYKIAPTRAVAFGPLGG